MDASARQNQYRIHSGVGGPEVLTPPLPFPLNIACVAPKRSTSRSEELSCELVGLTIEIQGVTPGQSNCPVRFFNLVPLLRS